MLFGTIAALWKASDGRLTVHQPAVAPMSGTSKSKLDKSCSSILDLKWWLPACFTSSVLEDMGSDTEQEGKNNTEVATLTLHQEVLGPNITAFIMVNCLSKTSSLRAHKNLWRPQCTVLFYLMVALILLQCWGTLLLWWTILDSSWTHCLPKYL